MLSSASKYAINAVLHLAVVSDEEKKIGAKGIASAIGVPVPFLAKLLQELARKNVISSSKGPKGGFYLTEKNKQQKFLVVVQQIDGLSKFEECVLGLKGCSNEKPCPFHFSVQPLRKQMLKELGSSSIANCAKKVKQGMTFLKD